MNKRQWTKLINHTGQYTPVCFSQLKVDFSRTVKNLGLAFRGLGVCAEEAALKLEGLIHD